MTIEPITHKDIAACPELLAEYADECSLPALGKHNPQWPMYQKMEDMGMMHSFGVFCGDEMVGFSVVLSTLLPHYGVKAATVETLFVSKNARDSGAGVKLMQAVEKHAKNIECTAIFYSAPTGGKLEEVLGKRYPRTNSVFCKPLA